MDFERNLKARADFLFHFFLLFRKSSLHALTSRVLEIASQCYIFLKRGDRALCNGAIFLIRSATIFYPKCYRRHQVISWSTDLNLKNSLTYTTTTGEIKINPPLKVRKLAIFLGSEGGFIFFQNRFWEKVRGFLFFSKFLRKSLGGGYFFPNSKFTKK